MQSVKLVVFGTMAFASIAAAQPTVAAGGILNAASYAFNGLPGSGIAQGSIFVVFGTGMGPTSLLQGNGFPLQTTLGGTSVKVTVNGTSVDAPLFYTSAGQLSGMLPSKTPVGSGTLTVAYNGQTSAPAAISVVQSSFGIFSVNQKGTGPGIITNAAYQVASLGAPPKPPDTLIIWGTGLGPVSGNENGAALPGDLNTPGLAVYVGGKQATVTYRGRSGCCAGLDQIVFQVPQGSFGCYNAVAVQIGNTVSNFTTMPLSANGAACSDPNGVSGFDLTQVLNKSTFSTGFISVSRSEVDSNLPPPLGTGPTVSEDGVAFFGRYSPASFNASQGLFQTASFGSCTVFFYTGNIASVDPIQPMFLDAGPVINVNGPSGSKQMTKQNVVGLSFYSGDFGNGQPPYLTPGSYLFDNGSGGPDIGNFKASANFPPTLTWTNKAAITAVTRSQGQNITWTGGDPSGYVTITGTSIVTEPSTLAGTFTCTAPVSAGQFSIPPVVLLSLPASTSLSVGGITIDTGSLSVGTSTNPVKFTAPNLDLGYIVASSDSSKTVGYR